jgi:hypothetical protein
MSFMADVMDWKLIDVTTLVQGWMDGDYDNFGMLLKQVEATFPRTIISATGGDNPPFLEVCYMDAGSEICEQIAPMGDVLISEHEPDSNFSISHPWNLYTGRWSETDLEKMSLIQFDLPVKPGVCTRTIGYWKNHAGLGHGNQPDMVTPLLPIWLGNPGGIRPLNVNTAETAVDVLNMDTYGDPSNGITKLMAQLLAAKLNIANGAADDEISGVITAADNFLARRRPRAWDRLDDGKKAEILGWKDSLDDYNNGVIGPGHCEDDDYDDDDDDVQGRNYGQRGRH